MRRMHKHGLILALSCVFAHAQTAMPDVQALQTQMQAAQTQIQAAQTQMQESMRLIPFLNAPIEDKTPLSRADIERFMKAVQTHKDKYDDLTRKLQAAFSKAARQLTPGVSYDTFVQKAVALSGVKAELDAQAKVMGYADAVESMIKTTRIARAFAASQIVQSAGLSPKEGALMTSMQARMFPNLNQADVEAIKPYMERLNKVFERLAKQQ